MSFLSIKDAPLKTSIVGDEKIPTGGYGDLAITTQQIKDFTALSFSNVDNTSDLDKPVSNATQAALNLKANITYVDNALALKSDKTYVDDQLALKASKIYVDTELQKTASKTYVDNQLATKASTTYVDSINSQKANLSYVDSELALKSDITYVDDQLTLKADKATTLSGYGIADAYTKTQVDASVTAVAGGHKAYTTLALAQAAQASLPANTIVEVTNDTTAANNGTYQWNGTTLTKSAYDPLTQAKAYSDQRTEYVLSEIGENTVMNAMTSTNDATFKSLDAAFIDGVLLWGTLPSDLRIQNFPSKATVDTGITNGVVTIRGNGLNYNSAAFTIPAGGSRIELLFSNIYFIAKFYVDFTKTPILAVNNNTSPYYLDVAILNVKLNTRTLGYFAKQSISTVRSNVLNTVSKLPKLIPNYFNDKFDNPIAYYPDLSTTTGAVPTNSNVQDPEYTLSYHLVNKAAYTTVQDDLVGSIHKYVVNFGTNSTELITVSGIFKQCEMLIGLKVDPAIIKTTEFAIRNGSGGEARYSVFDGSNTSANNSYAVPTLVSNNIDTGYSIWKIVITPNLSVTTSLVHSVVVKNSSLTTGTFDCYLFNPIISDKINYPYDIPYSKTQNSPWVGKNLMYFGDSNSRGNIAIEIMKNLGCNVYWNAAGGRSMQYRGVSEAESDLGWLYHWTRRSHIKNIKDAGKLLDLFLFNASYNDTSGGGTLSDAAIQAVLDNYPTLQDDAATVTAKLNIFNGLTIDQRKSIFGYKQTFAAYLLQIIQMFPSAKIFLTTMLYSPAASGGVGTVSGTVNEQRAYDKAIRDAINKDIRDIAAWYGVSVIDVNSNAGYYYGNMTTYTSDTIHFDEVIGKRIGYYTAKNILMQTQ